MKGTFDKIDSTVGYVIVGLMLPYLALVFYYSVVELTGPIVYLYLPACVISTLIFFGIAIYSNQPIIKYLKVGIGFGVAVGFSLFLSNFAFKEPYIEKYTVEEISSGKGAAVNWTINTTSRDGVVLYIHGLSLSADPKEVELVLYKGWLGFYFGNRA